MVLGDGVEVALPVVEVGATSGEVVHAAVVSKAPTVSTPSARAARWARRAAGRRMGLLTGWAPSMVRAGRDWCRLTTRTRHALPAVEAVYPAEPATVAARSTPGASTR